MGDEGKITFAGLLVLRALLEDLSTPRYGYELIRMTGLKSGSLYPIIARLEDDGLIVSERETRSPRELGRPIRRYISIPPESIDRAKEEIMKTINQLR